MNRRNFWRSFGLAAAAPAVALSAGTPVEQTVNGETMFVLQIPEHITLPRVQGIKEEWTAAWAARGLKPPVMLILTGGTTMAQYTVRTSQEVVNENKEYVVKFNNPSAERLASALKVATRSRGVV